MPMYDYYCKNCGHELIDELVDDYEVVVFCPECNEQMNKKMCAGQFRFKSGALQKHINKYGNSTAGRQGVPNVTDNGVRAFPPDRKM